MSDSQSDAKWGAVVYKQLPIKQLAVSSLRLDLQNYRLADRPESDDVALQVQRVDRAIQAYERANDRGHLVYSNVKLPDAINHSNVSGFLGNNFKPGTIVSFDRYTAGAHNLHQIEPAHDAAQRTAVFEIKTRRGMYLGRSDGVDDTAHLLPRGIQLRVCSTHQATYQRPDGSTGTRQVIQLIDINDD